MARNKNEQHYQLVMQDLKASGVETEEQAKEKIQNMMGTAKLYSKVAVLVLLIFLLALPRYAVFSVMIALIFLAWVWSSTIAGRQYIQRYIAEEIESLEAKPNSEKTH
ncbi:MAG: hypothetical protein ACRBHB_10745 [Arenicella sp.]